MYLESLVSKFNEIKELFNYKCLKIFNLFVEKSLKFFFVQIF